MSPIEVTDANGKSHILDAVPVGLLTSRLSFQIVFTPELDGLAVKLAANT